MSGDRRSNPIFLDSDCFIPTFARKKTSKSEFAMTQPFWSEVFDVTNTAPDIDQSPMVLPASDIHPILRASDL